jgi:molecular chaperone DnaJ
LSSSASIEDVKKAYKAKAVELHPDKNPECVDCQERFNKITKASETLTNPESKKFYDEVRIELRQRPTGSSSL